MSHRYGRHGPRAWLRWRKRHHRQSLLPALVRPEPRVIRIRIPYGTSSERIIFIIMADNGDIEITTDGQQVIESQSHALAGVETRDVNPYDREIVRMAEERADEDAFLLTSGRYEYGLYIQRQGVRDRAQRVAFDDVKGFQRGALELEVRARLRTVYIEAYISCFYRLIAKYPHIAGYVEDEREEALRRFAIADEAKPRPVGPDKKVLHHKRDLGVLRVMIVYQIDPGEALQNLDRMHRLTDKYEEYQENRGNEVIWPTEATFQQER